MSDGASSHQAPIIAAIIVATGGIIAAIIANMDWGGADSTTTPIKQGGSTEPQPKPIADPLVGFYKRDGLGPASPILKITHAGGNEYKLMVTNHRWPWEATVRREGYSLEGHGWFPESKATMTFVGKVQGDGSISSAYHFITKSDGTPDNERVDRHIWTRR